MTTFKQVGDSIKTHQRRLKANMKEEGRKSVRNVMEAQKAKEKGEKMIQGCLRV